MLRTFRSIPWVLMVAGLLFVGAAAQEGGDPEHGAQLFLENCAMCHGEDGKGRVGASLESFPGVEPDATIRQVIAQGISGTVMPAWGMQNGGPLSDQDIEDIAVYLVGILNGTEPVQPAPTYQPPPITPLPDIVGDPSEGAVIFQKNCAACHGKEAQGGFGWPLAKSWPGTNPDAFIRQVVSQGIEGTIMPSWGEQYGGPLSAVQVENVASYVLSLSPTATAPTPMPEPTGPLGRTESLVILGAVAALLIIGLIVYYRRA